jgi:hypothetical protein
LRKGKSLIYDEYAKPGSANVSTQVAKLTEDIQRARAMGKPVPPGVHAHLGCMHVLQGNRDGARQEFETEKRLFPESTTFIDGMLARMN